jgi:hypothetical protein
MLGCQQTLRLNLASGTNPRPNLRELDGRGEQAGMSKVKVNPYCPVRGCKTDKAHSDDPIVKGLIRKFGSPDKLTFWVLQAMEELRDSISRDLADGKLFAWLTRLRQPEELYIRTLYALFISDERELHHLLSGEPPNGLSRLYRKVNQVVFEGRGQLKVSQPGLNYGAFSPMDTLNAGAHVSFSALVTWTGLAKNPEYLPADSRDRYIGLLTSYCDNLRQMHELFKAGRPKKVVLETAINLHRPATC